MGHAFEAALENLELVFERFRAANFQLKPKKCVLFQTKVLFLEHRICSEDISTYPSKVESLQ